MTNYHLMAGLRFWSQLAFYPDSARVCLRVHRSSDPGQHWRLSTRKRLRTESNRRWTGIRQEAAILFLGIFLPITQGQGQQQYFLTAQPCLVIDVLSRAFVIFRVDKITGFGENLTPGFY